MEDKIPRRVRSEDSKEKPDGAAPSTKASGDQKTASSLLSGMAPPPVAAADASKKQKPPTSAPSRKSPMPSVPSSPLHSSHSTSVTLQQQQQVTAPAPSVSAALSDVENRTIRHLDKFIDVVSTSIKNNKRSASSASSSALLERISVIGGETSGRRESNKRGGVDLFGSFLTTSSNRHDFFTIDPQTSAPIIPPLPSTLPIFPEDFPPNGPKEWPLSWWGIVPPSDELLAMHEKVAEEVGYPIGKRTRLGPVDSTSGGGEATNEDVDKSKTDTVHAEAVVKEKQSVQRDRSRGSRTGGRQSCEERRRRDQRQVDDGAGSSGRRSLERRR